MRLPPVLFVAACGRTPTVTIEVVGAPRPTAIDVRGLPGSDLRALADASLTTDACRTSCPSA